jgi:hypothetical protein
MGSPQAKPDFTVYAENGRMSTVYLLRPLSEHARQWLDQNISEDSQWFGGALVVEHRYIGAIVEGIRADGLTVAEE